MVEIPQGNVVEGFAPDGTIIRARAVEGSQILRTEENIALVPNEAVVVSTGPACERGVKEGDRVLCRWWTGVALTLNGRPTVLTPERNILAIIDEGDEIEAVTGK